MLEAEMIKVVIVCGNWCIGHRRRNNTARRYRRCHRRARATITMRLAIVAGRELMLMMRGGIAAAQAVRVEQRPVAVEVRVEQIVLEGVNGMRRGRDSHAAR